MFRPVIGQALIQGEDVIPFTPFHFGPGFFLKALSPAWFWLTSFVAANVLIDVEVLYYLHRQEAPIHRYLHTWVGGIGMGLVAGLMMPALFFLSARLMPRFVGIRHLRDQSRVRILTASLFAGLLGGVSHIFLDSCLYQDMRPLWPFSDSNSLLGLIRSGPMCVGLAASGAIGLLLWVLVHGGDRDSM